MWRFLAVSPFDDKHLALETFGERQSRQPLFSPVKRKGARWHKSYAHAERRKCDYKIKTIQLHRRIDF